MKTYRIGKSILAALYIVSPILLLGCDIGVKVLNEAGEIVSEVSAGVPFQLHITAKGDCDVHNVEFSSDFSDCKITSLGTIKSVSNINRMVNRTTVHRYLIRIDQIGRYSWGPIKLWSGNKLIGQQYLVVDVVDKVSAKTNNKSFKIQMKASKQQLYVGEQFFLTVRFYFDDAKIKVLNLNIPDDFKDKIEYNLPNNPILGSEMRGSRKLNYMEWKLAATAKSAGQLFLPAVGILFEKISQSHQFFIFNNHEQNELFSDSLTLQVCDLPPTNQIVQGVGVFNKFSAIVDSQTVLQGQATQMSLILDGEGNYSKINLSLLDMPENLHVYDGKTVQNGSNKVFEFVIQGLKSGRCIIPKQSFFYFDTMAQQYKTLYTEPIELTVLINKESTVNSKTSNLPNYEKNASADLLDWRIKPILENGDIKYYASYYLPGWLFISLGLMPILILILKTILNYYQARTKNGFALFNKQLIDLQKKHDIKALYSLFTNVFAHKFNLCSAQINSKSINEMLNSYGVLPHKRADFCKFYDELAMIAFSNCDQQADLFKKAYNWLIFLEGLNKLC